MLIKRSCIDVITVPNLARKSELRSPFVLREVTAGHEIELSEIGHSIDLESQVMVCHDTENEVGL